MGEVYEQAGAPGGGMMMTTEDSLQYDENYEGAYEEGYDEGAYYQEDGAGAGAGEKQRCEECGKLVHPRALKRHVQLAHSSSQQMSQCPMCPTMVKSAMYLKDHLRRKHNVYQS